ncbi:MAG TPA: hypothetical protein VF669_09370 [Tepidisphaeraceae bacterium]|jgi:hypothetical protein
MNEIRWSAAEKKVARAAFERAHERELSAVRAEVQGMLRNEKDDGVVWRVESYLREKRREMNEKYDYRYSVLMFLFMRLYSDGYVTDEDLVGLRAEKVERIRRGVGV